ncbi:MAG: VCBS repeat-containing protein [Planctomycetes bacterium]|nr:VCBS repeat-containing protein [Planctomycetota bacterium]
MTALVAAGSVPAQSPHPFVAVADCSIFDFDGTAGIADFDRDGSPDLIVPGLFTGTMISSFDEDGNALALNRPGPALGSPMSYGMLPYPIAIVCGRIDGDLLDDVVMISNVGCAHYLRNLGATVQGAGHFMPLVTFDDFSSLFTISPPFVAYSFPVAELLDIDGDGDNDLLLAGGPLDRWSGNNVPGFVCVYEGDGAGGFVPHRIMLPGTAIDAEAADFDADGVFDHLVVLTENGSIGAFGNDILHFSLAGATPTQVGQAQPVGPGRMTALELVDVNGDDQLDYLIAQTSLDSSSSGAALYWFAGNGAGNVGTGNWGTLYLPATTGLGAHVCSLRIGDWNRDSHLDVAVLRGYTQAPSTSLGAATYGDSELLIAMGPYLAGATFESIPLNGYHAFPQAASTVGHLLPLDADPDYLKVMDLGRDGDQDLLVCGIRATTTATTMFAAVLRNDTPLQPGDARFEKIGEPTGGVATRQARIGFEGGRPTPGNPDFACNILNVQGGSLVSMLWGSVAAPGLVPLPMYGFDVHVAPEYIGCGYVCDGNAFADGFHSEPVPIPANGALIGQAGYFQYDYYDPASDTFGGTQATGLWIGN